MIATAGSDEKVAWALESGADEGINHSSEDVLERTREIAGEAGVEVVLDTVGGRGFGESLKLASHGGRVVALANVALTIYGFQITNLMQRLGYDPRADLAELADLAAEGTLEVHVDQVFALEEAADAHRHMEARRNMGKVMIHPAG